MPTRQLPGIPAFLSMGILVAIFAGILPAPATGQLPAHLLNEETEVRSIQFRFLDTETLSPSRLLGQIGLTERGKAHGLSKSLAFLPFFSEPDAHPFDPLSLQRDVARLRAFYRGAGFPEASIRYEVALDQDGNLVDVEFLISEGGPRMLVSVAYSTLSGDPVEDILAPEILPQWQGFLETEQAFVGKRFGDLDRARTEGSPQLWLRNHGYPFPTGDSGLEVDSTGLLAHLTVRIDPGQRSRIGEVVVEGISSVEEGVVTREVPFRRGDWYSASRMSEGRQRIQGLSIFRSVTAEVVPLQEPDSSVRILYRIREGRPKSISGYLGYSNTNGLAFGGEWEHRNFLGGARTLAVSGSAETGLLSLLNENPDQYYRSAVSLRHPFLFVSGLSFLASPFGEYRDDYRDRSWEAGIDGTAVYRFGLLQAVSLRARVSRREVLEYGLGAGSPHPDGSTTWVGVGDSLSENVLVSAITLSGTLENLDDPMSPSSGFVLQPSLEVTAPLGFPTNEYFKADIWGSFFLTMGDRFGLATNLRVGRIFPFGKSVPPPDSNGLQEFLQLRDVNLTAGGPTDVRGWGSRLMGPKVPDTEAREEGDTIQYYATRYLPLGGLARISGALELQFPIPLFDFGLRGHAFLDGGRVWTPDDRYLLGDDPHDQDRAYYSTGLGAGINTPVGPIRVSVGYKLNPSPLDLRDAGEVQELLLAGQSILEAPVHDWWRFQLHLTVGRAF